LLALAGEGGFDEDGLVVVEVDFRVHKALHIPRQRPNVRFAHCVGDLSEVRETSGVVADVDQDVRPHLSGIRWARRRLQRRRQRRRLRWRLRRRRGRRRAGWYDHRLQLRVYGDLLERDAEQRRHVRGLQRRSGDFHVLGQHHSSEAGALGV